MSARICLRSLLRYLEWWWQAVWPSKSNLSRLKGHRALFLFLLFPLFLLLQIVHYLAWMLDALLFPASSEIPVRNPIFITGIPRSGTTFVHRTLAAAPEQVTFSTWEALLAPAICEKRALRGLSSLDRRLGRPLRRLLDACVARVSGDFNEIHRMDLSAPEEDYLALLPFGACFIMALAFPSASQLRDLARFEHLPDKRQGEIIQIYHACLQKKLYDSPANATLLSKNAAFTSWLPALAKRYPDAKFLLCVREPLEGLSSQLSSLRSARSIFGSDPDGKLTARMMLTILENNLQRIASLHEQSDLAVRCRVLIQSDLKRNPRPLLMAASEFAGFGSSESLRRKLDALSPNPPSTHQHQIADIPIDYSRFKKTSETAYKAILDLDCRIQGS